MMQCRCGDVGSKGTEVCESVYSPAHAQWCGMRIRLRGAGLQRWRVVVVWISFSDSVGRGEGEMWVVVV